MEDSVLGDKMLGKITFDYSLSLYKSGDTALDVITDLFLTPNTIF